MKEDLLCKIKESIKVKFDNDKIDSKNYKKNIVDYLLAWDLDHYPIYVNKNNSIILLWEDINKEEHKLIYIQLHITYHYKRITSNNMSDFINTLTNLDSNDHLVNYLQEKYKNFNIQPRYDIKFPNKVISPVDTDQEKYDKIALLVNNFLKQKENKKRKLPSTMIDHSKMTGYSAKLFKKLESEYIPFVMNTNNDDESVGYEVKIENKEYRGTITLNDMKLIASKIKDGIDINDAFKELFDKKKRHYQALSIKKIN